MELEYELSNDNFACCNIFFSDVSFSRLEETAMQLACFKSADYLDSARNQSDNSFYGLFVRNDFGNKAVLLNRQTNEYVVYTDDWDNLYYYSCKELFNTCAKSTMLKSIAETSKDALFGGKPANEKSKGSAFQK